MRRKKGCSCINLENGVDAWSRKTRAHASLFGCEAGGQPNRRHVRYVAGALGAKDVVLDDERTRACGE